MSQSNQPAQVGSTDGLGLAAERALWDAMGCVADDEACLRMLSAHIAAAVAAERERCVQVCKALDAEYARSELPGFVLEVAVERITKGENLR